MPSPWKYSKSDEKKGKKVMTKLCKGPWKNFFSIWNGIEILHTLAFEWIQKPVVSGKRFVLRISIKKSHGYKTWNSKIGFFNCKFKITIPLLFDLKKEACLKNNFECQQRNFHF